MIRLKDIIAESFVNAPENRVNLNGISVIMEKILPELADKDSKKLVTLYAELSEMATQLNAMPYTKFNMDGWTLALLAAKSKVHELKEEITKIAESKESLDCSTLLKALDEIL